MAVKQSAKYKSDYILLYLVISLILFGVIMVFSSSYYVALNMEGDAFHYLKMDAMWAVLAITAMLVASEVNYRVYLRLANLGLIVSLVLLLLIFAPGVGVTINSATRWIQVGPVTLMPGEFAKIFAIIFVSAFLSRRPGRILSFAQGVLPCLALLGVYYMLINEQPNKSTALTVSMIILAIMFAAGLKWRYLIIAAVGGSTAVLGSILLGKGYQLKRLTSFLDPFADPQNTGYQVINSLYALGTGGLFGVGLGKSIQKTLYLPEPQNDFIFAIIGEEIGFIGGALLLAAYLILIWRGIHIAVNAPDLFSCLLATGITSMIGIQVILNIAVVTGSMPPTGISLPMISWGGNSLLMMGASMGILLNISKHIPSVK